MSPGELIRTVRRRHALSQATLARRAGTSQPVISAYEHDRRDPTVGTLRRIVAAGGEQLRIDAVPGPAGIPPASSPDEHGRRLLDVLSVADAIPARRRAARLRAPLMRSTG